MARAVLRRAGRLGTSLIFFPKQMTIETLRGVEEVLGDSIVLCILERDPTNPGSVETHDDRAGKSEEHWRMGRNDELGDARRCEAMEDAEKGKLTLW